MRHGDSGARVRELRQRLEVLGYRSADPIDVYGDATTALVEAGWQLGDRLLFLTRPAQRGDDVADLQVQLAQIGFNPGRIDGIFGRATEAALRDFQQHRGLEVDGTLTRATLAELRRMVRRDSARHLVTDALDLAMVTNQLSGPIVVCGNGPLVARVSRACSPTGAVEVLDDLGCTDVAQRANALGASLVLSLAAKDDVDGVHVHYWASYRSHSRRGERLASALASRLSRTADLPRVEVTGMALPILRETAMTTLHIEHGPASEEALAAIAHDIAEVVDRLIHNRP